MIKKRKIGTCNKNGSFIFNHGNYHGIIREIFSYIENNFTCLSLSRTCESAFRVFEGMLVRSSSSKWRLAFLNKRERMDNSVNLYSKDWGFNKEVYCATIEEYEKLEFSDKLSFGMDIPKEFKKLSIRTENRQEKLFNYGKITSCMINIAAKLNSKYGRDIFMISGGFAVKLFSRFKDFTVHGINNFLLNNKKKFRFRDHVVVVYNQTYINKILGGLDTTIEGKYPDIDMFVLGEDKVEKCREFLEMFNNEISIIVTDSDNHISIRSINGLVSLYYGSRSEVTFGHPIRTHVNCELSNDQKILDLILKKGAIYPNDIFSFFDLDCCKIGYFPGRKKVVASIDFIRAIKTNVNFFPFSHEMVSTKHRKRIFKYFKRLRIKTSVSTFPHQLSFYHTNLEKYNVKKFRFWIHKKFCGRLVYGRDKQIPHKKKSKKEYMYYVCDEKCPFTSNHEVLHFTRFREISINEGFNKYYYKMFDIIQHGKYGHYSYKKDAYNVLDDDDDDDDDEDDDDDDEDE